MRWLLLAGAEVPAGDGWLGPRERRVQAALRSERRRRDWRLGRYAAKRALAASRLAGAELAQIEILADADGAPHVLCGGAPAACALSLSHRAGFGLCLVGGPGVRAGCDLERIEPRSEAFVSDYFTAREREWVADAPAAERALWANLVWSAKESAVKALGTGWRVDTRSVEVAPQPDPARPAEGWHPLRILADGGAPLGGGWRRVGELLLTWASRPAGDPPSEILSPARPAAARGARAPSA